MDRVSPSPTTTPPRTESERDPFTLVLALLVVATAAGGILSLMAAYSLGNPVLLAAAIALAVSTGIHATVLMSRGEHAESSFLEAGPSDASKESAANDDAPRPAEAATAPHRQSPLNWLRGKDFVRRVQAGTGFVGIVAAVLAVAMDWPPTTIDVTTLALVAIAYTAAAGLAATAAQYLAHVNDERFPEAAGLCQLARVITWILAIAALSVAVQWSGQETILRGLQIVIVAIVATVSFSVLSAAADRGTILVSSDIPALIVLGSRPNALASVLDAAERQLGIDLRSTWALTVIRRSLEPLAIAFCLVAWLTTMLTVVSAEEEALVERFGVARAGAPLGPGLHVHWPWPIDRVFRIPVKRVQSLSVGHEGEQEGGPEDVLWARAHAANEYTLLLGDGRDLITVDAAVQFRIADARAWRYHSQNPADALRAIAYRAVMRSTVNRSLSEALSENVVQLTDRMRAMVQEDADHLGLGVQVLAFTVGGMHPPVSVAPDYQAVVSAELQKVTALVEAQAFRNRTIPTAEAVAGSMENAARAEGANALARGAGEAWSFRALESQYRAAPSEYFFRRRLETLEKGLVGRRYTVVDSRVQRDGGELWLTR